MEDLIRHWVKIVNEEYGKSDLNQYCIDFFTELSKQDDYVFLFYDWGYIIMVLGVDMWGEKLLGVVSFYIDKKYRNNPKLFIKLQNIIERVAKENKVDYIEQGSHRNTKLNDLLEKKFNYKRSVYRRYL